MTRTSFGIAILAAASLGLPAAVSAGEAMPLGHPDFYPSPQRPLGWRGDGTGAWPGANVVTSWDAASGKNVAWKVNTPGAGLCQPLVIGEKVVITADPHLLCCYNVHDGTLLWQTAIDHTLSMRAEDRAKARAEQAYFDELWKQYQGWRQGFDALLDAIAVSRGIAEPPAPANPRDKEHLAKRDAWQKARRDLFASVLLPGQSGYGAYLPKRDEPQGVELLRLLAGATELQKQYAALLAEQELHFWRPECGFGGNRTLYDYKAKPEPEWMNRYKAANSKYDIWFRVPNNWYAWTTYNFSTPITDGKYIYVATANNAVAAVDLEGKVAWQVWEYLPGFKNNLGTAYTTSPVLMDGKLVVYHRNHVRAYEAATGKKIWEHVDPQALHGAGANAKKRTPSNYNWRCPEASSPNVTRLKLPDGSLMPVVLDGFHLVWRLEDGAMVCNALPDHWKGGTSITRDDVYLLTHGGDRKPEYCGAGIRLRAESRDKVTWKWLWKEADNMEASLTPVLLGDRFIGRYNKGPSVSHHWLTGETQPIFGGKALRSSNSPIVAGNKFYAFQWDKDGFAQCNIGDLVSGEVVRVPVAVKDERLSGKHEFASIHWNTMCGYQQNSSPSAQANRILYRSRGTLWCIGDPTQKFPTPKDCPPQAKVKP